MKLGALIKAKFLTNALCSLVKISKIAPIMLYFLLVCLMLLVAYYAYYYASIIDWSLFHALQNQPLGTVECRELVTERIGD